MNLPIFVYWNVMSLWYFVTEVNVGLDLVWYFVVSTHWNILEICLPFPSFSEIPTPSYTWSRKKVPLSGGAIIGTTRPGARFSKVPVTFRARNQIFTSYYKE